MFIACCCLFWYLWVELCQLPAPTAMPWPAVVWLAVHQTSQRTLLCTGFCRRQIPNHQFGWKFNNVTSRTALEKYLNWFFCLFFFFFFFSSQEWPLPLCQFHLLIDKSDAWFSPDHDDDVELNVLRCRVDILGTLWPVRVQGSVLLCVQRNHKAH